MAAKKDSRISKRDSVSTDRRPAALDWKLVLPWVLVILASTLPYLNALHCGLVFDDHGLIVKNEYVSPDNPWWESLTHPYWSSSDHAGLYRPLVSLSYRLQLGLSGASPLPYHAFNILVHLGVCLLILMILKQLFPARDKLILAITLVFAIHPIHTEAVTGIVGRAELLGALFALAGYLLWLNARNWSRCLLIGLCFALAAGSKESVIGWPLLMGAHRLGWLGDRRTYRIAATENPRLLRTMIAADLAVVGGLALYGLVRLQVLGSILGLSRVTQIDNPIYSSEPLTRILTALGVMGRGIGLTIWPDHLSADYSFDAIQPMTNWLSPPALILPLLIGSVLLAIRYRRQCGLETWALAIFVTILLPVSNILFPIGTIMGERLLYLPSLGLIALGISGAGRLIGMIGQKGSARLGMLLLILAIAALSGRTWLRNKDWHDDRSLFRSVVTVQPRSVKGLANLGTVYSENGEFEEAGQLYRRSLALAPEYLAALNGSGYVHIMKQEYEEAEEILTLACDLYPANHEPFKRIGNLYLEIGRGQLALDRFDHLLELRPESGEGWIGKASAHFMLGQYGASADAWQEAFRFRDGEADLRPYLATALVKAGYNRRALPILKELLAEDWQDATGQHRLAAVAWDIYEQGETTATERAKLIETGLTAARQSVALDPKNEYIVTLARFLILKEDHQGVMELISEHETTLPAAVRDSLIELTISR